MKKRARHTAPQSPSPSPSPSQSPSHSSGIPHSAFRIPHSSWRPTLLLIGGAWAALLLCALLWQFWTGRALLVYFAAAVIGICFTLAALFERKYNRND